MTATSQLFQAPRAVPSAPSRPGLDALRAMLGPWSVEDFTTDYWGKRPLFIKGTPDKIERLFPGGFQREDFYRAARASAACRSTGFKLLARGREDRYDSLGDGPRPSLSIQPEQMQWLFTAGANLRADNLLDLRLTRFAAALKADLRHVGDCFVAATLSPLGNGWPAHIDRTSVIFIQSEGRKRFTISPESIAAWPDKGALLGSDGAILHREGASAAWEDFPPANMAGLIEVILEPGDLLFLPPGVVHATEALTEASLTLDVLFSHENALELITRTIETILKPDPNWRHLPSINGAATRPGELPTELARFIDARLDELRAALARLGSHSPELNREWQRSVAHPGEITLAQLMSQATPPPREVGPATRLRLSTRAPMTIARAASPDGEATLDLYFAGKEVSVAGPWVPFLATMVQTRRFIAGRAIDWSEAGEPYPWPVVRASLETLLAQGILELDEALG